MNTSGTLRTGYTPLGASCRAPLMLVSHRAAVVLAVAVLVMPGCSGDAPVTTEVTPADACFAISDFVELPRTRGWRTHPSLADVDGDGDLDLAATTRKGQDPSVFIFDPSGWRAQSFSLGFPPCGAGMELVDLTADGSVDLLVADHCSGLFIFKGDGKGTFSPFARLGIPSGQGFNDAATGDVNGDGLLDIVALASFSRGYSILFGEEPGKFAYARTALPQKGYGWEVHLEDLNGDGRLDIYGTLQGFRPADAPDGPRAGKVWLQGEAGSWSASPDFPERGNWFGIARGDFDEDGQPDFAMTYRDDEAGVRIFRGTAPGMWAESDPLGVGSEKRRVFTGIMVMDMDGDGHQDIVSIEHRTPTVVVWLGDGDGRFIECPDRPFIDKIDRPGWGVTAGDVDRDGALEVIAGFGSEGGGLLKAWSYRPTGKRPAAPVAGPPSGGVTQEH